MSTPLRWLIVLTLTVCTFAPRGTRADEVAGRIQYVRGPAHIRASPTAPQFPLSPKSVGQPITYFDLVQCDRGGYLSIKRTHGGTFELGGPSPWTPLPHLLAAVPSRAKSEMDAYARAGGRDRGQTDIFSPAPLSVVAPSDVVFRWTPRPNLRAYTLALLTLDGQTLWRQAGIDAATGQLVSQPARDALRRAAAQKITALTLRLTDQDGRRQELRFGLLSPAEQSSLDHALAVWDTKPPLARHLGRAAVCSRYGLDNAAAEEYDAALALAPDDPTLQQWARDAAQRLSGNSP